MYLHVDKENFRSIIESVSAESGRAAVVIEKDYYVTLILRLLSEKLDNVVFKGSDACTGMGKLHKSNGTIKIARRFFT